MSSVPSFQENRAFDNILGLWARSNSCAIIKNRDPLNCIKLSNFLAKNYEQKHEYSNDFDALCQLEGLVGQGYPRDVIVLEDRIQDNLLKSLTIDVIKD